jgi:hypothetical protein
MRNAVEELYRVSSDADVRGASHRALRCQSPASGARGGGRPPLRG